MSTTPKGAVRTADWRPLLEARPLPNVAARPEPDATGGVVMHVPRTKSPFRPPLSWIVRVRSERRVQIDALGAFVWKLCDGTRTVEQIVDEFSRRHGLTFHEARVAVTGYLASLIQRGVLAITLARSP